MPDNYVPNPKSASGDYPVYAIGQTGQATAADPAVLLLPANRLRRSVSLFNSGAATVYYGFDPTVDNTTGKALAAASGQTVISQGNIYIFNASGGVVSYVEELF